MEPETEKAIRDELAVILLTAEMEYNWLVSPPEGLALTRAAVARILALLAN